MNKKEIKKIEELISKLDTASGKLLVPSMKDKLVKEVMQEISEVSFELGNLLDY